MAVFVNTHLILKGENSYSDLEFYLNDKGQIFAHALDEREDFFFLITKEDWKDLKEFIDDQFSD